MKINGAVIDILLMIDERQNCYIKKSKFACIRSNFDIDKKFMFYMIIYITRKPIYIAINC